MDQKELLIINYIRALIELNGAILPAKIVEVFNNQNTEQIVENDLMQFDLSNEFFDYDEGYFAHEVIWMENELQKLLAMQGDKPFYIPEKETLLKFSDDLYFDRPAAFNNLKKYVIKHFGTDLEMAEGLCEDIMLDCNSLDFSIQSIIFEFERRRIEFKDEAQIHEVMALVMDLANNTRLWVNRGHTPSEVRILHDQESMTVKVGRNDPCPCGSGKKFKQCCGK